MKYVLSNGKTTRDLNTYIIDLFRVYTTVYKNDIPGSTIGYDFILSDVKKDELPKIVDEKCSGLVSIISDKVKSISGATLSLISVRRLEADRFTVSVSVSHGPGDEKELNVNLDL